MNYSKIDILLIEDNEYEARLAIHNLKKHDLTDYLVHIKDGADAADFLFGQGVYAGRDLNIRPSVVLLDINLPRINGLDLLRMIKSDERTKTIPVVLLTSSRENRDVHEGYAAGANSYIVKPIEFEAFSRVIKELGLYWVMLNQPAPYVPDQMQQAPRLY